jgi:hypothetical protein
MHVARFWLVPCLIATIGCGSSAGDSAGTGGSNGGGGSGTELEPAPNIDVDLCAAIREEETNASDRCWQCCDRKPEVVASSFIHRGQCTCAKLREEDPGKTICADATADGDTCASCCGNHDFLTAGWVGSDGATGAVCACGSHQDRTVCAAAARSQIACGDCCVHAGYIGTAYGSGTCTCSGP